MCFEARYTLLDNPVRSVQTRSAPTQLSAPLDDAYAFFANPLFKPVFKLRGWKEVLSPEVRKEYEEAASTLADHAAFIGVLGSNHIPAVLWPARDKTADQLRPDPSPNH